MPRGGSGGFGQTSAGTASSAGGNGGDVTSRGGTVGGGTAGAAAAGGGGAAGASGAGAGSGGRSASAGGANAGSASGGTGGGAGGSGGGLGGAAGSNAGGTAGGAASAGSTATGGGAITIAASIDKFRFECPCKAGAANHTSDGNCNVTPETDRQTIVKTLGGDASKTYDVTLRVRGLTEPNKYKNGTLQGERFYVGGTTDSPGYTSYMMTVADPPQHFFFNYSPTTGHVHFKLDYQVKVKMRGGSRVTFDVDGDGSVPDGHQVSNFDQTVVPDIPPAPMAYDGQFVQLDVVSVEVAP
jgi:hypothetical protein